MARFPSLGTAVAAVAFSSLAFSQHAQRTLVGAADSGLGWSIDSTADIDGDGVRELILSGNTELRVASGATGATLWSVAPAWPLGDPARRIVSGIDDIDGDGAGDVLIGDRLASSTNLKRGIVRAYSGASGALLFELTPPQLHHSIGEALDGMGDVDGDGAPDFLVAGRNEMNSGIVRVHSGVDAHVIHEIATGGSGQVGAARVGDLDADGVDDFVAASASAGTMAAYSGAAGARLYSVNLPGGYTRFTGVDDVDGDGHADFAASNEVFLGMPARLFSGATGTELRSFFPSSDGVVALGDFDGDGRRDLALFGRADAAVPPQGLVVSTGTGTVLARFSGRRERGAGGLPEFLAVCDLGDVTGDGARDFAVAQASYDAESPAGERGKVWIYDSLATSAVGTVFGAGDGSGAPCPCGNTAPNAGAGCANSTGQGATLAARGSTSIAADDFVIDVTGMRRDVLCSLALGTLAAPGQGPIVGAGRRVIAGPVLRMQTSFTALDGATTSGVELARLGLWTAGDTVYLQAAYRDPNGLCGASLNLSNGLRVTFTP